MEEKQTKEEKPSVWWPATDTADGAKSAVRSGIFAALWLAGSYLIGIAFVVFTGQGLYAEDSDPSLAFATLIINTIAILLALFIAWRLWKFKGHYSATVLLVWVVTEVAAKAVVAPGKGIIVSGLLLLCAVQGVRGAYAARSQKFDVTEKGN